MTSAISRRLAQLEKAIPSAQPVETWVQICVHAGEAVEEVMARYLAEHPGQPTQANWIVIQGVAPNHGVAA